MPSTSHISCHLIHGSDPNSPFPELLPRVPKEGPATCYVPVEVNPKPTADYTAMDLPYSVHWSIDPALLISGGIQVQVEVDGCQKGQPRSYENVGPDGLIPSSSVSGIDNGLWVIPDGTRRRPWVMGEVKTTHPHSALADKYILDRVGSVSVTFSRATIVPTSHVVPLVPIFSGSAPLPERLRGKISHWTRLGYIETHPPAPELGLVAEEVHEIIAHFTFFYRSKVILEQLLPGNFLSDVKISFPNVPSILDGHSVRSAEDLDTTLSGGRDTSFEGHRNSVLRRALGAPRHSVDGSTLVIPDKNEEKEEFGKFGKFGGKRVRAVSLRVAKRYSLLGNKSEEKAPSKSPELGPTAGNVVTHQVEDLNTIESLRNEVLHLRLEINELKKHFQP